MATVELTIPGSLNKRSRNAASLGTPLPVGQTRQLFTYQFVETEKHWLPAPNKVQNLLVIHGWIYPEKDLGITSWAITNGSKLDLMDNEVAALEKRVTF